jgi:glycerophosphoryl diester phosphodiesterase
MWVAVAGAAALLGCAPAAPPSLQLGERPFYLVDRLRDGHLKERLQSCAAGPFRRTMFSLSHRGAPLQFPEHTREGYTAAARMGAGAVECDVTFTRDGALVCRHDECDLRTTTNIEATPLTARCASELTLAEFRSLKGRMEADAQGRTPAWRTDLYSGQATLMTLEDSIRLNRELGVRHVPELKAGDPERIGRVFGSQAAYAQKLIDTYRDAGVDAADVMLQSFDVRDIRYWLEKEPAFGRNAVYLDGVDPTASPPVPRIATEALRSLHQAGLRYVAPPIPALLAVDGDGRLVASPYAREIRALGLDIIAWSLERSDLRRGAAGAGFYYAFDPTSRVVQGDGDVYLVLDALAREVGVKGVFSDWPATTSYYASCMGFE